MNMIIRGCFEPVAIYGAIGIILACFYTYRKKDFTLRIFIMITLLMIIWRPFTNVQSSRYAIILLFPVIFFSVFFCRNLNLISAKIKMPDKYISLISCILFVALIVICVGKLTRYNRYDDYLVNGCSIIKKDSHLAKKPFAFNYTRNYLQIYYYTKLPIIDILEKTHKELIEDIKLRITEKPGYDVIYFFYEKKTSEPFIEAEALGITENSWTLIYSQYLNNKKNKQLCIYKFQR